MEPTGLMRWHNVYNDALGMIRTLQYQWGKRNGWAWHGLEWRDVPEVFE